MAYLLNEQNYIENNIFKYEDRINSPLNRFLEKAPTFVTYYHVNYQESTVDEGFKDIESILSTRSPLRFQKIENFPLYGIEQIQLQLNETDQGLDTNFESNAVILPNSIKPFPNDFFKINHIKGDFLFRVTEIQYDNLRPDNFYQINFKFEYLDDAMTNQIENQVHEKFTCILDNIGTENTCIISNEDLERLQAVDALYSDMIDTYMHIYYSKRYNCFLGELPNGYKLFDPLQSVFFNKNKLLVKKKNYSTIVLSEGFLDNKRQIKYEKSIYRFFERRDVKLANTFQYNTFEAMMKRDSAFARWNDQSIIAMDIPKIIDKTNARDFLPAELVNSFKLNGPTESKYIELMQKFIRNEGLSIYDIPLDLNEELLRLDANEEVFLFTPILLYIVHNVVNGHTKQ